MELRHLRYFVVVAEELHFTRASQRLGIGQPPLSQQIQQLEQEIGSPLFRRLPRGVALTEAGLAFFFDAKAILAQVDRATRNVQRIARGDQGAITIGMINSAPFNPLIQRVLREYREQYPQVQMSLTETSTPELAKSVLSGTLDAAFVRPLISDDMGLVAEPLFDEDVVIALPSGHPLSSRRTLQVADLARETFVLFTRVVGSGLYDEIISACQRAGFSPRIEQQASQVTSIVNLVAAGLGVSMVPESMKQINSHGVTYRRIEGDVPRARMSVVYREHQISPALANLLALAHKLVGEKKPSRKGTRTRAPDADE